MQDVMEDSEKLLEEMLLDAEKAPEPGTVSIRDILHRGDEEYSQPVVVNALNSAGYTYLYNANTGDRSLTNNNMLRAQLEKRDENGKRVFTTIQPKMIKVQGGKIKCLLHPDSELRTQFDEWGMPTCNKANIVSPYQLNRHMQLKHPTAFKAIEENKAEKSKADDRMWQQKMIEAALGGNRNRDLPEVVASSSVVQDDVKPIVVKYNTPSGQPETTDSDYVSACFQCGKKFSGVSEKQAQNMLRLHSRTHNK